MEFAKDGLAEDPFQINKWGSVQKIDWHDVRVEFSPTTGFCIRNSPENPHPATHPFSVVQLWKDSKTISSSSRPSSGSSTSSFKSKSSRLSQQSATLYTEPEIRVSELLKVPYNLVLCEDYLRDYSYDKDSSLIDLWDWMDANSSNRHIALKLKITAFLCMAYVRLRLIRNDVLSKMTNPFLNNPWFDYVAFLPTFPEKDASNSDCTNAPAPLTVPSVWSTEEQNYLIGTSLEISLPAKMSFLKGSFEAFQKFAVEKLVWAKSVTLNDWIRFEACYTSRSLETQASGPCMVPCLDMVNHSYEPNAHFVQDTENGDIVLMKYDDPLGKDDEITINYAPENGAAESLLKYGFIDPEIGFNDQLSLLLPGIPCEDESEQLVVVSKLSMMNKAGGDNRVIIKQNSEGEADWESPFAYLLALSEEDGLVLHFDTFCIGISMDDRDISEHLLKIKDIISDHPRERSIKWRVINIIMKKVNHQIREIEAAPEITDELAKNPRLAMCRRLRELEMGSLVAIKRELRKQASATRPGLRSMESEEITTSLGGLTFED